MTDEQQLIESYLDGELTSEEEGRLTTWLAADSEHVRLFVRETWLHRQLREAMLARSYRAYGLSEAEVETVSKPASGWLGGKLRILFGVPWPPVQRGARTAMALCLVLATVLGVWWLRPFSGQPVLAEVQGPGLTVERADQRIQAAPGAPLKPGDVLRTPTNAVAVISYAPEKTRITLEPGTELKLASSSRGKRFELRLGKLEATVARQRPFRPMTLKTAQAEAKVMGTHFFLVTDTNATCLEVTEGKVRFTRPGAPPVKVAAGQYAVAATNVELTALPLTGSILREYWTNYQGSFDAAITSDSGVSDHPQVWEYITRFETPPGIATRSGERVRGYVHPPTTGEYSFSVANTGPGDSFLFLSPDDRAENRVLIAGDDTTPRGTGPAPPPNSIRLVAGRNYYIEVLHKADAENGQCAVRWRRPTGEREVIPGAFLSPVPVKERKGKR